MKITRSFHITIGYYLNIYFDDNLELNGKGKGLLNELRKSSIELIDKRIKVNNKFIKSRYEKKFEHSCFLVNVDDMLKKRIF